VTPLDEARREAEAALAELPPHAEDTRITSLVRCARALRALLAVLPSPALALPTAVADDAVTAWARLAVALLSRHESAWDHDPGPGDDDCNEDCRACEYVALLRTGRAALDALAPPADAATEAVRMLRHLCNVYGCTSYGRTPDHGPDDCSWCEAEALLALFPAPAPSAKEDTIEHPCGCYAPDGDTCRKHAAPSTHALRRCEQGGTE